jgi:hypothetical protein
MPPLIENLSSYLGPHSNVQSAAMQASPLGIDLNWCCVIRMTRSFQIGVPCAATLFVSRYVLESF